MPKSEVYFCPGKNGVPWWEKTRLAHSWRLSRLLRCVKIVKIVQIGQTWLARSWRLSSSQIAADEFCHCPTSMIKRSLWKKKGQKNLKRFPNISDPNPWLKGASEEERCKYLSLIQSLPTHFCFINIFPVFLERKFFFSIVYNVGGIWKPEWKLGYLAIFVCIHRHWVLLLDHQWCHQAITSGFSFILRPRNLF